MKRILLTFTGFHDPYNPGLTGEEQAGPILTLVSEMPIDMVVLFSTPNTTKITAATRDALAEKFPQLKVETRDIPLYDPINYIHIIGSIRNHYQEIARQVPQAEYYISVTSGTPQMHACWFLLAASGEIPAKIINVRPKRFISDDRPLINFVDFTDPQLPIVRFNVCSIEVSAITPPDLNAIIRHIGIVGDDPALKKALEISAVLAGSALPVLILGESGTGKELFSQFIHQCSGKKGDLVAVNSAGIPETLAESMLFGHEKGAFTGANKKQDGMFVKANGGTLFLDELAELSPIIQAKLLRVLQDGKVDPLGAQKPLQVNARIIAATNKDLIALIKEGKFREDLYYRLNVGVINLPALRSRRDDIPKLALHFLDLANKSQREPKYLTPDALRILRACDWPGNIRTLQSVIQTSAQLAKSKNIDASDLIGLPTEQNIYNPADALPEPYEGFSLDQFMKGVRNSLYAKALKIAGGNQTKAARLLGVSSESVRKMKSHFDQ